MPVLEIHIQLGCVSFSLTPFSPTSPTCPTHTHTHTHFTLRSTFKALRPIRPVLVSAARAGNQYFVDTLNDFYHGSPTSLRIPVIRSINTMDLVPGFPNLVDGFALDQGGILVPLGNSYATTIFEDVATQAKDMRCGGRVHALSLCQSPACDAQQLTLRMLRTSMDKHHDATTQVHSNVVCGVRCAVCAARCGLRGVLLSFVNA